MKVKKDRSIFFGIEAIEGHVPVESVERVESVVVTLNSTRKDR
jgi:hypothetical protein